MSTNSESRSYMYGNARDLFVFNVLQQYPDQRDVNARRLQDGFKLS